MGKSKFDRKKAVRFTLIPGPQVDGKPTVLYKPVQTKHSKVSKKQRKNIISKLSDYEEITINGKPVNENEIPAFVLQQIRGRTDLVFNQKVEQREQDIEGDLYEIQDGKQDDQYQEYQDYDDEDMGNEKMRKPIKEEDEDGDWQDQSDEQIIQQDSQEQIVQKKPEKFNHILEEFPVIQTQMVQIQGKEYALTKQQVQLLNSVIPDNYEQMDFGGLNFKKYNQDGLLFSEKQKYQKYLLGENEKVVVVDTYEYEPAERKDIVDNDMKPSQITGNVRQIEQALDYDGEEGDYEELEDDFFSKLIQQELRNNKQIQIQKIEKEQKVRINKEQAKIIQSQLIEKKLQNQKDLQQQLSKALKNFQNNIQQNNDKKQSSSDQQQIISNRNHSMNFTDIEKRQQYIGRDGQLDWRCLTKDQKKQYMKTKVIRQYYDELRERQIQQKLKGKTNVTADQLHLKTLIKHITYEQDHVMRSALENDAKETVNIEEPEEYSSLSQEEDDIVSFHQKTSIIASNLSIIEQPIKKKNKKQIEANEDVEQQRSRIKVIPQKRQKQQTPEQRKARKEKLKQQKKQKRQQKKQFAEKFSKVKRENMQKENPNNPLNKVSYIKIY